MATIQPHPNGTLTVVLTALEDETFARLPEGQFAAYLTLWLSDHAASYFKPQFDKVKP